MTVDVKNSCRLDLIFIYDEIRQISEMKLLGTPLHPDQFAISENEVPQLHSYVMEACAYIAKDADMMRHYTQSGVDAISYHVEFALPSDQSPNADGEYTGPDQTTVDTDDLLNHAHHAGQKMDVGVPDYITFSLDGLDDDSIRYTVVQEFVKKALISYALMQWWKLKSQPQWARESMGDYQEALAAARFNPVSSHRNKSRRVRVQRLGF